MSPQQVVAANAAIANNEKLFPTFEQRLASDDQALFVKTATRLSSWLDSEKAYYEAARPRVSLSAYRCSDTCINVLHRL